MLGAIIGDVAGSRFEWNNIKVKDFDLLGVAGKCRMTDDSYMSLAVAKAVLEYNGDLDKLSKLAIKYMQEIGRKYPYAGYGGSFKQWLQSEDPQPYNSYGNGSAMRVSACGFAANSLEEAIYMADAVTKVSHSHPEGMKGAEAVAAMIYLAKTGSSIADLRDSVEKQYYKLDFTLDSIRAVHTFDVSCQGSVPQAIEAFLESKDFEDSIRNAISIGGDSDTIAAIAGSIAEAYYGIPETLRKQALTFMDTTTLEILNSFESKYQGVRL